MRKIGLAETLKNPNLNSRWKESIRIFAENVACDCKRGLQFVVILVPILNGKF